MPRGRRRAFDRDAALDIAMDLFWRRGYAGTSIADLTAAMGINPPSLYAAFGNKRGLFEEALSRYEKERSRCLTESMAEPTARGAVLKFLTGTAEAATLPDRPPGCLTVQGGLACGAEDGEIVELLATSRARTRHALHDRLEKAVTDGDLPPDTDCAALARCVFATAQGLNVEASAGATYPELAAAAEVAARVIPAAGASG
ncbi:TetR/AcrR family transcriptional regulator [Streptomyces sp. NBC_00566]|uniref:TetR/AcrR family transcriptional regulator n=1 Tax=Streptomyces sp. NBC_00566 TaxID=2975778 RepID=UPI002E81EF5D|nr:TetR/AcrR family transcriptional regulator [Streptomyces sp. NBC_00566]WUB87436.1 TetR/AcrR family transcriptional regulator [Streptomyces sp. NBC_00566]